MPPLLALVECQIASLMGSSNQPLKTPVDQRVTKADKCQDGGVCLSCAKRMCEMGGSEGACFFFFRLNYAQVRVLNSFYTDVRILRQAGWVPFDLARPLLDKQPFVCLSESLLVVQNLDCKEDSTKVMEDNSVHCPMTENQCNKEETAGKFEVRQGFEAAANMVNEDEMNNVLLKFEDNYMQFKQLREFFTLHDDTLDELRSKLQTYVQLVGNRLAARMAYILV
ncbi:hypothetical protein L7F22_029216 [Adiantum nelumboides]|nr:hypothetical protein [Adiantum nelumboides]